MALLCGIQGTIGTYGNTVGPCAILYYLAAPYGTGAGVSPVPYRCFTSADEYCGNAGDYEGKSEGGCENESMCVHANWV